MVDTRSYAAAASPSSLSSSHTVAGWPPLFMQKQYIPLVWPGPARSPRTKRYNMDVICAISQLYVFIPYDLPLCSADRQTQSSKVGASGGKNKLTTVKANITGDLLPFSFLFLLRLARGVGIVVAAVHTQTLSAWPLLSMVSFISILHRVTIWGLFICLSTSRLLFSSFFFFEFETTQV